MKGDQVVRMTPYKMAKRITGTPASRAICLGLCVSSRPRDETNDFAKKPATRGAKSVGTRLFRTARNASRKSQAKHGRKSIGGITSSRCTNEEVYVVQKFVRAAMGNNNVDTCARVCHSPTGYGLKQTSGHIGRYAALLTA